MFKFIEVKDYGQTCCPHCGAEGRYIYTWEVDGVKSSAMAGCYKALTGSISKSDEDRYFELLSEKQAKGKSLNGWDKSVIRLLGFLSEGKYSPEWIRAKISETVQQRALYLAKKRF